MAEMGSEDLKKPDMRISRGIVPFPNVSMRIRLFAFLFGGFLLMAAAIILILLQSGVLPGGDEARVHAEKEFARVYAGMDELCGEMAVRLVHMSETISRSIERQLASRDIAVADLSNHPGLLEEILSNELSGLQFALDRSECTSAFIVLDATVNPMLPNAGNSKAGLFIAKPEPRPADRPDTNYYYYRGFPEIAYDNSLIMQKLWSMEFDVQDGGFFHLPIEKSRELSLPLNRLHYWSMDSIIPGVGKPALMCSVPLIDSGGNPFGVCGFEFSEWNFLNHFTPDSGSFSDVFVLFGQTDDTGIMTGNALYAGKSTATAGVRYGGTLALAHAGEGRLNTYITGDGKAYMGLSEEIVLVHSNSVFYDNQYALSLLIDKGEIDALAVRSNMTIIIICVAMLILGCALSLFISINYTSPIKSALNAIADGNLELAPKTNIKEIDRIIEKLRLKDSHTPDELFEDFFARHKTLTPAEAGIFKCYFSGMTNDEIMKSLFITDHTLKAHNRHIFAKLAVSSKNELLLYIEMIKKSGLEQRIS